MDRIQRNDFFFWDIDPKITLNMKNCNIVNDYLSSSEKV